MTKNELLFYYCIVVVSVLPTARGFLPQLLPSSSAQPLSQQHRRTNVLLHTSSISSTVPFVDSIHNSNKHTDNHTMEPGPPPMSKGGKTLAGPYVINCCVEPLLVDDTHTLCYTWALTRLAESNNAFQAWQALHSSSNDDGETWINTNCSTTTATLQVCVAPLQQEWKITTSWSGKTTTDVSSLNQNDNLCATLEAVAIQWAINSATTAHNAAQASSTSTSVVPTIGRSTWRVIRSHQKNDDDDVTVFSIDNNDNNDMSNLSILFQGTPQDCEWVEMVDHSGHVLGRLPRPLVHTHNILHRGIGVFVTQDRSIFHLDNTNNSRPDLYVHQRTSTKRIFPSLYDMFVGGVSSAGESSRATALREVAEELDLHQPSHLSARPLLSCVICTLYNRCVVDLYEYVMDTTRITRGDHDDGDNDDRDVTEKISWQAEEVAWGAFCPYALIEAAADRSMQRLVQQGVWPGQIPLVQSPRPGEYLTTGSTLEKASNQEENDDNDNHDFAWQNWDFVPDGLLVWQAWLRYIAKQNI